MNIYTSTFDFSGSIVTDGSIELSGIQSVTIINTGDQDASLDGFLLEPLDRITLKASDNSVITQNIAVVFSGTGTKELSYITETITSV